jgi:hypothetical protein
MRRPGPGRPRGTLALEATEGTSSESSSASSGGSASTDGALLQAAPKAAASSWSSHGRDTVHDDAYVVTWLRRVCRPRFSAGGRCYASRRQLGSRRRQQPLVRQALALLRDLRDEMVMFNFCAAKVPPGTRILGVITIFEHALMAYKGHIHPATLRLLFVAKLSPSFRGELFAHLSIRALPADGDAGVCDMAFREQWSWHPRSCFRQSSRPCWVSAPTEAPSTTDGAVDSSRSVKADSHNEYAAATAVAAVVAGYRRRAPPKRKAFLHTKCLCVKCGLLRDDGPPPSVCSKQREGHR